MLLKKIAKKRKNESFFFELIIFGEIVVNFYTIVKIKKLIKLIKVEKTLITQFKDEIKILTFHLITSISRTIKRDLTNKK